MLRIYLLIGAALLAISLLVGVIVYVSGAEEAKDAVITLNEKLEQQEQRTAKAEASAKTNAESFLECKSVNAANAQEADEQKDRADAAVLRLARLEGQVGRGIEVINREADSIRGQDTTCRTVDEPLPEWFVAGLRQPTTP